MRRRAAGGRRTRLPRIKGALPGPLHAALAALMVGLPATAAAQPGHLASTAAQPGPLASTEAQPGPLASAAAQPGPEAGGPARQGPARPIVDAAAAGGYSGLGLLPSPQVAGWGRILLGYETALPGQAAHPKGHNLLVGVGLLPGFELAARLATNDWSCNMYGLGPTPCTGPTLRDLSASFKIGHRFEAWPSPRARLSVAVGATDLGGAATTSRSAYAVAGLDGEGWRLQAGHAQAESSGAPLSGPFAALAWRPFAPLQLQAEALGQRQWIGARLLPPARWLPQGVEPWLGVQMALQDDRFTPRHWWAAGLNLSLERPDAGRTAAASTAAAARAVAPAPEARVAATAYSPPSPAPAAPVEPAAIPAGEQDAHLTRWARRTAQALGRAGFEDISIGEADGALVVEFENSGYAWNDLDGLGVALGLVLREAGPAALAERPLDLRLSRRGIALWRVQGAVACLQRWMDGAAPAAGCSGPAAPRFRAGALAQDGGLASALPAWASGPDRRSATRWWVRGERASFGRLRLSAAVDLDTRVGTEYGTLDTSAGIDLIAQMPLWRGATADLAYVQALGHSRDYAPGEAFADFRIDSQLYRVMLHQALPLGPGLAARVAVGRLFKRLDGGAAELRWQPGDGRHRLSLDWAHFRHTEVDFQKRSHMLSYRYFAAPIQTAFEVRGGQFWHGDQGAQLQARHWFGDVSVSLLLRRSHFLPGAPRLYSPYGNRWVNAAGLEFSFPLTPRRGHVGQWVQLRGQDRLAYGVQTVVGQKTTNYLTPWFGRLPPVPMGLADSVDNFDRASQAYLEANLHRLREAWRVLGAAVD